MSQTASSPICPCHEWERRLENHGGVECVVRVCPLCGHKELCWSRQGLAPETAAALRSGARSRPGGGFFGK